MREKLKGIIINAGKRRWLKNVRKLLSFEPDSNQRPKDANLTSTVLRSTNWAIEGHSYNYKVFNNILIVNNIAYIIEATEDPPGMDFARIWWLN